jgi:hypothetical protein
VLQLASRDRRTAELHAEGGLVEDDVECRRARTVQYLVPVDPVGDADVDVVRRQAGDHGLEDGAGMVLGLEQSR